MNDIELKNTTIIDNKTIQERTIITIDASDKASFIEYLRNCKFLVRKDFELNSIKLKKGDIFTVDKSRVRTNSDLEQSIINQITANGGQITTAEICTLNGVSQMKAFNTLKLMKEKNLIYSVRDESDRRKTIFKLRGEILR